VESKAAVRCSSFRLGVSDVSPLNALVTVRWNTLVVAADSSAVCRAECAGQRAVLSGVVPGPRGTVAVQPGVVLAFFYISGVDYFWCERRMFS
jgi:hypothetical protein